MSKKTYVCGSCKEQVSDKQQFCNHCGSELASILPFHRILQDEDLLGETIGEENEDIGMDLDEVYGILIDEFGGETVADFFGTVEEFKSMVVEASKDGEESATLSEAEAVDALLQMFYAYVEDPESFLEEELGDSVATNKKARYVVDTLMKAGVSRGQALALVAYHGSLKNIRSMKDAKGLLKYKYLKDMMSEKEAQAVIDYFTGKKTPSKKVAGGLGDSAKVVKHVCGNCEGEISDSQKFCNHCGAQFDSEKLVYEEGKYYTVQVSKKDLAALRKRFEFNRDGQVGTFSNGFEVSGDKTKISGKGKIWKTVIKILNEVRSGSKIAGFNDSVEEVDGKLVCEECGGEVGPEDKFCKHCGAELGELEETEDAACKKKKKK